jgi:Ca2+/Na+ antiporter
MKKLIVILLFLSNLAFTQDATISRLNMKTLLFFCLLFSFSLKSYAQERRKKEV